MKLNHSVVIYNLNMRGSWANGIMGLCIYFYSFLKFKITTSEMLQNSMVSTKDYSNL